MKNFLTIAYALSVVLGATILMRESVAASPGLAALPQGAPLKTLQGTVKVKDETVMFVADEDGKSWEVMNPDTLKPHAGHHVEIRAHVNSGKGQLHVMSVKIVKNSEK
jgi:hypothetical protein